MFTKQSSFWRDRFIASGLHAGASLLVASAAGLLVFGIWYPYPYQEISGGRELFLLIVSVDVTLGPMITFAVFNRTKSWRLLRRDLAFVALIQLSALAYGLWTVCIARPVHLVFEYDRFTVVHAIDISPDLVIKAPAGVIALPFSGPTLLALRPLRDSQEKADLTLAALGGQALNARPDLWQPYSNAKNDVLRAMKPVGDLKMRFPANSTDIDARIRETGRSPDAVGYLPMAGRKYFWTVLVDTVTAEVVAFIPLDSF